MTDAELANHLVGLCRGILERITIVPTINTTSPTYEEVFGDQKAPSPPPMVGEVGERGPIDTTVYGTLTEAPLSRAHFSRVLKESGFDPVTGFVKWGLEPFDSLPPGMRQVKLETIQQAGRENAVNKWAPQVIGDAQQRHYGGGAPDDITHCPKCNLPGRHLTSANGAFYICTDAECRLPNGKHTAWDERNWAKRKSEVRSA